MLGSRRRNPMSEETQCRICDRRLTVPESVKREIGPVCWGRLQRGEITEERIVGKSIVVEAIQ